MLQAMSAVVAQAVELQCFVRTGPGLNPGLTMSSFPRLSVFFAGRCAFSDKTKSYHDI